MYFKVWFVVALEYVNGNSKEMFKEIFLLFFFFEKNTKSLFFKLLT